MQSPEYNNGRPDLLPDMHIFSHQFIMCNTVSGTEAQFKSQEGEAGFGIMQQMMIVTFQSHMQFGS